MNATELYVKDGRAPGVYYCEFCKIVYRHKEQADKCCQPHTCCECGAIIETRYQTACDECVMIKGRMKERERFASAEKITEWPGWVYCEDVGPNDGYFQSDGHFLDYWADEHKGEPLPKYIWTCSQHPICELDYDNIIENATCDAYEDWEADRLTGVDELKSAIAVFNEANKGEVSYTPNYKRALLLNT